MLSIVTPGWMKRMAKCCEENFLHRLNSYWTRFLHKYRKNSHMNLVGGIICPVVLVTLAGVTIPILAFIPLIIALFLCVVVAFISVFSYCYFSAFHFEGGNRMWAAIRVHSKREMFHFSLATMRNACHCCCQTICGVGKGALTHTCW